MTTNRGYPGLDGYPRLCRLNSVELLRELLPYLFSFIIRVICVYGNFQWQADRLFTAHKYVYIYMCVYEKFQWQADQLFTAHRCVYVIYGKYA